MEHLAIIIMHFLTLPCKSDILVLIHVSESLMQPHRLVAHSRMLTAIQEKKELVIYLHHLNMFLFMQKFRYEDLSVAMLLFCKTVTVCCLLALSLGSTIMWTLLKFIINTYM